MFIKRFLKKTEFNDYEDYRQSGIVKVPENFNYAYDVIDVLAEEQPDLKALYWTNDEGKKKIFTFKDISELSNQAVHILKEAGVAKGDTVLIFLRRHYMYWVLMMALHKLGAVAIPSTSQLKAHDITYRLDMANIKAVVALDVPGIMTELEEALKKETSVQAKFLVNGEKEGWIALEKEMKAAPKKLDRLPTQNDNPFLIYFTSGTTGMPKMVLHDYTYPLGHIHTAFFWQQLRKGDLHFTLSETGWAKCSWGKMYGQWMAEATVFVYDFASKFEPHEMLKALEKHKITSFCAAPTVYKMLIRENFTDFDLSSIQKAEVAGEPLNPEIYRVFLEATGVKLKEGFGQSETSVMLFTGPWFEPRPGSMGKPAAGWQIDLLDESDKPVETKDIGEVCVKIGDGRPAGLFLEYMGNKEQNKKSFRGGYYHTGDMAYKDEEGYFWFVGRNDDLIKSSGYRISPFEVESTLLEHPAVKECAVTGAPDEIRGVVVKASIILNKYFQPSDALIKDIQAYVKKTTAPYKYPRIVEFVDELPMTISGKIKRAVIRTLDQVEKVLKPSDKK